MTTVAVCDYGAGNTRSVLVALERLGLDILLTADPAEIFTRDHAILPGVGSARQAIQHLTASRAADALRERFAAGRSIIGICLGMQLALAHSEEDGGVETLHLFEGDVRRLEEDRVPRLGWAQVTGHADSFYFAHSYACWSPFVTATSEGVAAVIQNGSFLGVQFHPEKSGPAGSDWMARCLLAA